MASSTARRAASSAAGFGAVSQGALGGAMAPRPEGGAAAAGRGAVGVPTGGAVAGLGGARGTRRTVAIAWAIAASATTSGCLRTRNTAGVAGPGGGVPVGMIVGTTAGTTTGASTGVPGPCATVGDGSPTGSPAEASRGALPSHGEGLRA